MFKLSLSKTYHWPVSMKVPSDGGTFDTLSFEAEFKRLSQTQIDDIVKKTASGELTDKQVCQENVVGWREVHDESGELKFSKTLFDKLLDVPGMAFAIAMALVESMSGERRKN